MKRLVIITVGKTHSGKSTFARDLEQHLHNSIVIDQDNHAEFINTTYSALLPREGPNTLKYALTQTIVEYAITQTDAHIILCNTNRHHMHRLDLLNYFRDKGFSTVLVYFNIPDQVLHERVANSRRSTKVFRTATTFEEVLIRQQNESLNGKVTEPTAEEADYFFEINSSVDVQDVRQEIVRLV